MARRMDRPLVSVVVAFYNHAPFARETVESILAQTYPNLEIILTDDGSTDGTREIVEALGAEHPDRVTALTVDRNTGISGNMNRGLGAATGELVAVMSGDDLMLPEKIERQVEVFEREPGVAMCLHDAEVFLSPGGQVLGRFTELYNGRAGVRSGGVEIAFDATYLALPSTFMFPADVLPPHGFDDRLRVGNEIVWHIEIMRRGRVVGLQDMLVRYRRHAGNTTINPGFEPYKLEEHLMSMAVITARYPELHAQCQRRTVGYLLQGARESFTAGRRRRGVELAFAAARHAGLVRGGIETLRLLATSRQRSRQRDPASQLAIAGPRPER
jgi:glycosyltransferase involved in cell wall biosynthesis